MSTTLMRASRMSDEQIDRHEALVQAGFRVREVRGGYDLINDERDVHRGPFETRGEAWEAAEELVP
ncbi:MAG: hypothetical protein VW547_12995 [Alphaproteobacteria bacterium]|jgi:hypothetical protein